MASIILDIAVDFNDPQELKEEFTDFMDQFELTHEVLDPSGPAGGHPVVEIDGTVENIKKYLLIYCGDDEQQAEEFHNDIEE